VRRVPEMLSSPAVRLAAALSLGSGIAAPAEEVVTFPVGETVPGTFTPTGLVVFLTDFGVRDDAVALCKGVMLTLDGSLRIVDLTHQVTPYDVDEGAFYLAEAADAFPSGTVFVGVIDPGVGTDRKAVVIERDDGQVFVVPDNGLAAAALSGHRLVGAWEIEDPRFMAEHPSATFHGRDVFSPAGAVLAAGRASPHQAGVPVRELVGRTRAAPTFDGRTFSGTVELLDKSFGNVWTDLGRARLEEAFPTWPAHLRVRVGDHDLQVPLVRTFGDVPEGEPLAYLNSRDRLSLAVNQGSFAGRFGVQAGDPIRVSAVEGDDR